MLVESQQIDLLGRMYVMILTAQETEGSKAEGRAGDFHGEDGRGYDVVITMRETVSACSSARNTLRLPKPTS